MATVCNNVPVHFDSDNKDRILKLLKEEIRPEVDRLIEQLLMFKPEPHMLSRKIYTAEDKEKYLQKLFKKTKINQKKVEAYGFEINEVNQSVFTFERFKEEAAYLYSMFQKSNANRTVKTAICNDPLQGDEAWTGKDRENVKFMLCSDILPMAKNRKAMSYTVLREVEDKLTSFEKLQKDRDKAVQALFEGKISTKEQEEDEEKSDKYDAKYLVDIAEFCAFLKEDATGKGKYYEKDYTASHFKSFVNFLRSNLKYMREAVETQKSLGKDTVVFESQADYKKYKIKTGYSVDFMNLVFNEYLHLWYKVKGYDDIRQETMDNGSIKEVHQCPVTDGKYSRKMVDQFKYLNPYINVSKYEDTEKFPRLHFGKNYSPFNLNILDNGMLFDFSVLFDGNEKAEKIQPKVCHSGYFRNLNIADKDKKNKTYLIEFTTCDSSEHSEIIPTKYRSWVREPSLRYDVSRDRFYCDLSLSDIISENNTILFSGYGKVPDPTKKGKKPSEMDYFARKVTPYFKAAFGKGETSTGAGENLFGDHYNAMGVDLGIRPIAALAVYEVQCNSKDENAVGVGGSKVTYKHIKSHVMKNPDNKSIKLIEEKTFFFNCVKMLIDTTRRHLEYLKDKELGRDGYPVRVGNLHRIRHNGSSFVDFLKSELGFDSVDDYLNWVEKNLYGKDIKANKRNPDMWAVPGLMKKARSMFSGIRSEYWYEDTAEYIRNFNFASTRTIRKIEAARTYISLANSYTFLGLNEEEREVYGKTCPTIWNYINGLRNFLAKNLASAIVHHAIKNKVNIVFIEDLNVKASFHDSKEDNRLKSLWGVSMTIEYLESIALKHGIFIQKVNPTLTSQIDAETLQVAYRSKNDKSDLFVNKDGKIRVVDSDVNAAKNIAIRGITRHSVLPTQNLTQVNNTEFVLHSTGAQRTGALMYHLSSESMSKVKYTLWKLSKDDYSFDISFINSKEFKSKEKEREQWLREQRKQNKDNAESNKSKRYPALHKAVLSDGKYHVFSYLVYKALTNNAPENYDVQRDVDQMLEMGQISEDMLVKSYERVVKSQKPKAVTGEA